MRKSWQRSLLQSLACVSAFAEPSLASAEGRMPQILGASYVVGGDGPSVKIINGEATTWYPTVGALLHRDPNTNLFVGTCTATLIGCSTILTAAHCIRVDWPPSYPVDDIKDYKVFFQHGGTFDIATYATPPEQYVKPNPQTGAEADIAVLKLTAPVTGIAPDEINGELAPDTTDGGGDNGHPPTVHGMILGFGSNPKEERPGEGDPTDYGLKRFGSVTAVSCPHGFPQSKLVCWTYPSSSSNTCVGDSGGPLFLPLSETPHETISGVTSGGVPEKKCLPGDKSFDTSVFYYRKSIKSAAGSDLGQTSCGQQIALEDRTYRHTSFSGQINDDRPVHVFEVEVKDAQELRVGVNMARPINMKAQESIALPQLSLINGKNRDTANALCAKPNAIAALCNRVNPTDGFYTIVLERQSASGTSDFQLVVSVF